MDFVFFESVDDGFTKGVFFCSFHGPFQTYSLFHVSQYEDEPVELSFLFFPANIHFWQLAAFMLLILSIAKLQG